MKVLKAGCLYDGDCNVAFVDDEKKYQKPKGLTGKDVKVMKVGDPFQKPAKMTEAHVASLVRNGYLGE